MSPWYAHVVCQHGFLFGYVYGLYPCSMSAWLICVVCQHGMLVCQRGLNLWYDYAVCPCRISAWFICVVCPCQSVMIVWDALGLPIESSPARHRSPRHVVQSLLRNCEHKSLVCTISMDFPSRHPLSHLHTLTRSNILLCMSPTRL